MEGNRKRTRRKEGRKPVKYRREGKERRQEKKMGRKGGRKKIGKGRG